MNVAIPKLGDTNSWRENVSGYALNQIAARLLKLKVSMMPVVAKNKVKT
jgi:hypothetical protein